MTNPPGFRPFRGLTAPAPGDRVRVYRNLNHPGLYSLLALSGPHKGKVLGYAAATALANVEFKVSEKGRQTVLAKQVRHVHAYAQGEFVTTASELPEAVSATDDNTITYRPFAAGHFFRLSVPQTPVWHLTLAWASGTGLIEY
jgi:hypothetical protein